MKVVHVNYYLNSGGATIAMKRIHFSLIEAGIDSKIIGFSNDKKNSNHDEIAIRPNWCNWINNKINLLFILLFSNKNRLCSFPCFRTNISKVINDQKPDVVHLHWIANGMMDVKDIAKINSPVIWTLHDYHPVQGIYNYLCEKNGQILEELGKSFVAKLLNKIYLLQKKNLFDKKPILFQATTQDVFDKTIALNLLPKDKIILLGLIGESNNFLNKGEYLTRNRPQIVICANYDSTTKGLDLLAQALDYLYYELKVRFELVTVGGFTVHRFFHSVEYPIKQIGKISNEQLVDLFNQASLTVVPSRIETFGQVGLESLMSGTPVVSFQTGAMKEYIVHQDNGYLANNYDVNDFAKGISLMLGKKNTENYSKNISLQAHCWSQSNQAKDYIKAYKKCLKAS